MFSKFLKLIKRALVRGGNGNLVPKISGRNPIEIFRNMKWLGVRQKSAISKATLQTVWKNDDIRKEVNRILLKDFFNKRLSKEERDNMKRLVMTQKQKQKLTMLTKVDFFEQSITNQHNHL